MSKEILKLMCEEMIRELQDCICVTTKNHELRNEWQDKIKRAYDILIE